MSSEPLPPEFFFDRSLGKRTAQELRALGWVVHLIADRYPNDAQDVTDEEWIAAGVARGWALLSKDRRIRYRGHELGALHGGQLFCLSSGNQRIAEMTLTFEAARPSIERAVRRGAPGFWHVFQEGRIARRWP